MCVQHGYLYNIIVVTCHMHVALFHYILIVYFSLLILQFLVLFFINIVFLFILFLGRTSFYLRTNKAIQNYFGVFNNRQQFYNIGVHP